MTVNHAERVSEAIKYQLAIHPYLRVGQLIDIAVDAWMARDLFNITDEHLADAIWKWAPHTVPVTVPK